MIAKPAPAKASAANIIKFSCISAPKRIATYLINEAIMKVINKSGVKVKPIRIANNDIWDILSAFNNANRVKDAIIPINIIEKLKASAAALP